MTSLAVTLRTVPLEDLSLGGRSEVAVVLEKMLVVLFSGQSRLLGFLVDGHR